MEREKLKDVRIIIEMNNGRRRPKNKWLDGIKSSSMTVGMSVLLYVRDCVERRYFKTWMRPTSNS